MGEQKIQVYPAIDILGGEAVRLSEGDYGRVNIYERNPLKMADKFIEAGVKNVHLVDLDGAREGSPVNFPVIEAIAKRGNFFVEVGGGIRDRERIERMLDAGVDRVILGTAAVRNPVFVAESVREFGSAIAVSIDAKNGLAAVQGWQETTSLDGMEFAKKMRDMGVETLIYTDISKDGMLAGTNIALYEELHKLERPGDGKRGEKPFNVIASGGVTFESEIETLMALGLYGVIIGKALYEGRLDLGRVMALCRH